MQRKLREDNSPLISDYSYKKAGSGVPNLNLIDDDVTVRKLKVISDITQLNINVNKYNSIREMYNRASKINSVQRKFDTDIASLSIIFVMGLHNMYGYQETDHYVATDDSDRFHGLRPVSIKFISSILSFSRETVRRRLVELHDNGLVIKTDGNFVVRNWSLWDEIFSFLTGGSVEK